MYTATKTFTGLPCAHRQWRDEGHCRLVHGYDRTVIMTFGAHTLDHKEWVVDFGGLKKSMPLYAGIFLFTSFASIGLPGLNGFVGEFMILMGSFPSFKILSSIAAFGVVLAAIYMLWAYQRIFNGQLNNDENAVLTDLNSKELVAVVPLLILMLFIGVYPSFVESYIVNDVSIIYDAINSLSGVLE